MWACSRIRGLTVLSMKEREADLRSSVFMVSVIDTDSLQLEYSRTEIYTSALAVWLFVAFICLPSSLGSNLRHTIWYESTSTREGPMEPCVASVNESGVLLAQCPFERRALAVLALLPACSVVRLFCRPRGTLMNKYRELRWSFSGIAWG